MITTDFITLVPAYGRDYREAADVERHFLEGKDFYSVDHRQYCSVRNFAPGVEVVLRFANRTKVITVTIPGTV